MQMFALFVLWQNNHTDTGFKLILQTLLNKQKVLLLFLARQIVLDTTTTDDLKWNIEQKVSSNETFILLARNRTKLW